MSDKLSYRAISVAASPCQPPPHHYFCSTPPEAYFRPDRMPHRPARADAVKDGRRRALAAGSAVARPLLDGIEHDGTLAVAGRPPQSCGNGLGAVAHLSRLRSRSGMGGGFTPPRPREIFEQGRGLVRRCCCEGVGIRGASSGGRVGAILRANSVPLVSRRHPE